jgi:hypothetical protein
MLNKLVNQQNEIAHGKKLVINTLAEYQPYEEAAFLVMHKLAVAVVECLERKIISKQPTLPRSVFPNNSAKSHSKNSLLSAPNGTEQFGFWCTTWTPGQTYYKMVPTSVERTGHYIVFLAH